jgi:hypothetical protein
MITMGSPYFVWINANGIISSWHLLGAGCVAPLGGSAPSALEFTPGAPPVVLLRRGLRTTVPEAVATPVGPVPEGLTLTEFVTPKTVRASPPARPCVSTWPAFYMRNLVCRFVWG